MENAKQGDIKGAFILKANIGHDPVVMATMKTMAIGGFVVLVLVLAGFHLFSSRSIVRPLSIAISHLETASIQTTAAAGEISGSSHSLAEGAAEQAAAIEQTSASLEELSSMTKGNAENSHKANELAKHSRATADRGLDDMRNMSAAMTAIRESSNNISVIIKTIDEIAFQTNILALNAAVEAARAGEAGMGFAVVANEVRSLAQRSAQAAKETAVKIEDAIGKAALGVEINQKVGNALNEIVGKAYEMDKLAAGVASASSEQTQGITQINVAVGEMDKVVQANAASAEECAAAAAELNAQAGAMREAVTDLVQLVGHHAGKSAAAPKAAPQRAEKAIPAAMPSTHAANGHGRSVIPAKPKLADRRKELPMDGDFKDF